MVSARAKAATCRFTRDAAEDRATVDGVRSAQDRGGAVSDHGRRVGCDCLLGEIGRELAAEIERVFEAKVNPRALEKKAERLTATNVAQPESPATTPLETGDNGDIVTPQEVVVRLDVIVKKGKSV